ncbi:MULTISPECIES: amino acid ABC transporter permease [unclassified Gilliamella]|uniref:amino acid ABC transporter permease n=1 Tax=unclassified Gilliamella TaxID=2685620 RepID=UPI002269AD07|nr:MULTISPECIES: amino acid ABC transporter permease [unclassified Gilliamella]MCX8573499.1 amino acid ABC transporter permease [Gilliamella sp. B3831]MCX8575873.1 amino acid ABC transporter permease [Gilliamella sp. B3815]MCX8589381.1 amino acid ABC transporter permease [Gilliamella sp. B3812]MCX8602975.1 amino acid ABC transporter permease [Gilliamella sp. B3823]MCX8606906.1 amino acid ABC transporter permease [Gilliamella sp. B3825]
MFEQLLEPRYLWWLWDGFLVTLAISLFTIILSTVLGFLLVIAQQSHIKIIKGLVTFYNAIFRYSPLLPQLFFWYFGVGNLLPIEFKVCLFDEPQIQLFFLTLKMPSFEFIIGLIALTFYSSAFIAEEFRAGILGVAKGQQQASLALGLTWWQTMRFIILPQSVRIAFPPLIGQYMNIIKNSSLTMAIGVLELSYVSRQVETESLKTFQDFAIATLLYILAIVIVGTVGNIYQASRLQISKG